MQEHKLNVLTNKIMVRKTQKPVKLNRRVSSGRVVPMINRHLKKCSLTKLGLCWLMFTMDVK